MRYRCRNRAVYWQDPERILLRRKEIRQEHPGQLVAGNKRRYEARKAAGTHLDWKKKWEQNNPDKVAAYNKAYAETHREQRNETQRQRRRKKKEQGVSQKGQRQ
jgi:hypothetical protein